MARVSRVVGVDPVTYRAKRARPHELVDGTAGFRLLLCHFPAIVERMPTGSFDLILAGHLHAGQICLPLPGRRITLAHPSARYVAGVYETDAGVMHVSPGTGTTFVPFRFFARPEVTELVLRAGSRLAGVEGNAVISHDLLASYAADAALEVEGVRELVDAPRRHRGVRVSEADGAVALEVHLALDWGARADEVGTAVQSRVAKYLVRTAKLESVDVDVVVDDVAAPASR